MLVCWCAGVGCAGELVCWCAGVGCAGVGCTNTAMSGLQMC